MVDMVEVRSHRYACLLDQVRLVNSISNTSLVGHIEVGLANIVQINLRQVIIIMTNKKSYLYPS